jgi:hypothetical protein
MNARMMSLALLLGMAGAPAAAQEAGEAPRPPWEPDVLFGFRGVGEVWQDPAIVQSYRSSRFSGAGFAALSLWKPVLLEAEVAYMRQASAGGRTIPADEVPKALLVRDETGALDETARYAIASGAVELMPVTFSVLARKDTGGAELFAGAGLALAVFNERTDAGTVSGIKPGLDMKAGVRVHTHVINPPVRPSGGRPVQGMDVELLLGRRQHHAFGLGSGFDFSAWRIGIGLTARL